MSTNTTPLEVNFHGPIAFRFCKNEVFAYLPKCTDHRCNILTDVNDMSVKDCTTVELRGPVRGTTHLAKGDQVVTRNWTSGNGPKDKHCRAIFRLPSPDEVYGLGAEYVKIEIPNEKTIVGDFARGIRFFYRSCATRPRLVFSEKPVSAGSPVFNASHYGPIASYQFEVRYHDVKFLRKYDDHQRDALSCSQSMRRLFPPCNKWKVSFQKPPGHQKILNTSGMHPVDCLANIIAFMDGVSLT